MGYNRLYCTKLFKFQQPRLQPPGKFSTFNTKGDGKRCGDPWTWTRAILSTGLWHVVHVSSGLSHLASNGIFSWALSECAQYLSSGELDSFLCGYKSAVYQELQGTPIGEWHVFVPFTDRNHDPVDPTSYLRSQPRCLPHSPALSQPSSSRNIQHTQKSGSCDSSDGNARAWFSLHDKESSEHSNPEILSTCVLLR